MASEQLFDLSDGHRRIQQVAREVAAAVDPFAAEADECPGVHERTAAVLRESGLARQVVPAAHGGESETLDPLSIAVVREALMYSSAHLDSLFGMQGVGSYSLSVGGAEDLKAEWLPKVAALEAIAGLALTEPDVGSDLRAITTTIERRGGDLVVRGRKSFITNGGAASFYCVLGKEDDGYSMVLVPASSAGLKTERGADIIAPHILGELTFDDVVVPEANRLGEPGKAFSLMLQTLAVFRVTVAGSGVGLGQAAVDEATAHATTRTQFGRPLLELGAVGQNIASSWADVESARAMTYRAASLARTDPLSHLDYSSIAKVVATEAAGRAADRAVQSMGRFGLVRGSKIERLYRNARPLRVYEGATEVLLDSLARRLGKEAAKKQAGKQVS
ncbi:MULTISPECIES: acyl-CoA dehydrogenase family protein [Prauserella salsuginis group]|uniref:Acyl-CoA dehydrogenase n=2 Tax=Prauserella salsuginis group TaxID=2893672 RepID=A0A839XYS0_9PSEU|nr:MULTISPECIES: acyl-CoA dehydrogenase family protein [Prauserella salsuginis group]MBB3665166.1 acyl-CoA dehydrogenase [Prauserella sediminis]MCR3718632.1 acyl-CoA dehydrogenase [Prauserella flava]MCR3733202.1 acyl-CoA dehydrogenase [Prauserella salsuginis]